MRTELHCSFVLHRRPYRETSLLVEAFSSVHGRVALIAKGASRPRSRLSAILQLFSPLLIAWSGRGELGTLTAAETAGPPWVLSGRGLLSGLYVNEILMRVLHRDDPHPGLFDSYRDTIERLGSGVEEEPVLRNFEKRMLEEIGYALVLDHDVDSNAPIDPEREYFYQYDKGPRLDAPPSVPTFKIRGRTLIALATQALNDPVLRRESKYLMRFVLGPRLGDKPLLSRRLFQARHETRKV